MARNGLNAFELVRYSPAYADDRFLVSDIVAVFIDGRDLVDILGDSAELERDGKSWAAGMPYDVVAPPSEHWRGRPVSGYCGAEGVAVLDAGCGVWECCGPGAAIEFDTDIVTWRIRGLDPFRFDRNAYEAQIAGLTDLAAVPQPTRR
jgi:hypothetical protein